MSRRKVGVVGAGNVGGAVAHRLAVRGAADVVLVDVAEGLAEGKALDLAQSMAVEGSGSRISGGTDMGLLRDCDVVVITAGIPRRPGMSRDDLLATNAGIVKGVAGSIRELAPRAVVIPVTNPLDVMTYLAWKVTGFEKARVVGMAGVLDAARFAHFIGAELGASVEDINAMVLGGHGDSMVPLPRHTTVAGVPLPELMPPEHVSALARRTRDGGAEIVKLLRTGSAFYAPGAAAAMMAECVLAASDRLMPASAILDGEYGERDLALGVPVILGAGGIRRVVELPLSAEEKAALGKSAAAVREGIGVLQSRGLA